MSKREKHMLGLYVKAIKTLSTRHASVTIGEVARDVGVSRNTAKKYIWKLVDMGIVGVTHWDPVSGVNAHSLVLL